MKTNISLEEAGEILSALTVNYKTEYVPMLRAQGRVLAEDVFTQYDVPPFDRSPYDGYALRGEDTALATDKTPVMLKITEELPAGTAPTKEVTQGTAAKILTGAPIPEGANAIVKYELTEFDEENVTLFAPVKPGSDIVRAGEDVRRGTLLCAKGAVINPAMAGAMAGQGMAEVRVFCRPRILVMSTGSELLEPGRPLQKAKIYNSNVYTISAYLEAMGTECVSGGCVPDDPDKIALRIRDAAEEYDMVVTTGGASVGDYDFAVRSAEKSGANVLFWKVSMKPGGSLVASEKNGRLILGLSGNPGAAIIALLRVVSPYVKRLCGRRDAVNEPMELIMKEGFGKKSPKRRMLRGYLSLENGAAYFVPNEGQGNGVVSSFIVCDLLGEVPAGSPPLNAGDKIMAYRV